jgi:hypothetical protein
LPRPLPNARPSNGVGLPDALTPAALGVCAWGAASGAWLAGVLPAIVAAASVGAGYALWLRRGRPWHDWHVIALLLPALPAALWLAVGGTALDDGRSDVARILLELGPGLALTGLVCSIVGYHGKHHPDEKP